MFLNARYGLAEILEDGLDVHVEPVGNVLQLEVLLKAQAEDAEVRLGEMSLCVVADGIERLHPLLVELPVVTKLDGIELAELVGKRHLPDAVDAFSQGLTMASIFFTIVPMMCFYPFLQRYFVKGIVVGAIKG